MDSSLRELLQLYLQPTPAPPGMTSREIVWKAIEFDRPPRIPFSFMIPLESDFFETAAAKTFIPEFAKPQREDQTRLYYDEWGVGYKFTGRFWDQAVEYPLQDLQKLDTYRLPEVAAPRIFDGLAGFVQEANNAGKYVIGFDPVLMFERMRALLGFEELMVAHYTQPGRMEELLDRLTGLEIAVIEQWARLGGVHGFMTWDDWGLQTGLQMNPKTFRQFYKPRYARIVEAAHRKGMHYIWHNCGQILDIIPDMVEIGVDVVQLDQPRLMGHQKLADQFGGKICFWNTLDIQWSTMGSPGEDAIRAEIAEMVKAFNRFDGGFIARHYPQPEDIGMSSDQYITIRQAFLDNGCSL